MTHGFIPVPNVASVELIYTWNGEHCENVFYVQKGSSYTLAQLQALRGIITSWDSSSWATIRGSGACLVRVRTRARDSASAPTEDYTLPSPSCGLQGGSNL